MTPGRIVLLNGASSSGKTSIIRSLQRMMDEPYLDAGLDRFLFMLPGAWLERPLWDEVLGRATHAGEVGYRLVSGMHHAIAALARQGNHVVVDHVLVEPGWREECAALFADFSTLLVGVRCPLVVLEERERTRKNRTLGQARAQFEIAHAGMIYDLEVDTSLRTAEECAAKIKEWLINGEPPHALAELRSRKSQGAQL